MHDFGKLTQMDLNHLVLGERLGGGIGRDVYDCLLMPGYVIKIEDRRQSFQNIMELETWETVEHTEFAKWFAPVWGISPAGTALIQAKTKPLEKFPKGFQVPSFMTDLKPENFGRYKGRIVAHDYGLTRLMTKGLTRRMRPAD